MRKNVNGEATKTVERRKEKTSGGGTKSKDGFVSIDNHENLNASLKSDVQVEEKRRLTYSVR